ncbi:MAG: PIG-L deacetylase family protein [Streptosporangiaceae bacterium]
MIATAPCYSAAPRAGLARAGWLAVHAPRRGNRPQAMLTSTVKRQHTLPRADRVLTVTARPGQESADLGALLYTFGRVGARVALLSLTRGEASRLNSTVEPLESVRPWELRVAAHVLGVSSVAVADYPDGRLSSCELATLAERVSRAIADQSADLVLVTDPAESGLDGAVVAMAACEAARAAGVPTLARTVSAARGGWQVDLGDHAVQARAAQRSAVAAHASQSGALADLTFRLRLLGRSEWLRWLAPPTAPWAGWRPPAAAS